VRQLQGRAHSTTVVVAAQDDGLHLQHATGSRVRKQANQVKLEGAASEGVSNKGKDCNSRTGFWRRVR
jgi:hypothetical protein